MIEIKKPLDKKQLDMIMQDFEDKKYTNSDFIEFCANNLEAIEKIQTGRTDKIGLKMLKPILKMFKSKKV